MSGRAAGRRDVVHIRRPVGCAPAERLAMDNHSPSKDKLHTLLDDADIDLRRFISSGSAFQSMTNAALNVTATVVKLHRIVF